jgi:cytochrome b subunit of formate dehydrogenase
LENPSSKGWSLPAKILRHAMSERVFHWLMSVAMIVLLVTAFFPIVGVQFAWVEIHWIAGLALTAIIIYHIIQATFWQDFWAMWIDKDDLEAGKSELSNILTNSEEEVAKAGKYPVDHKLFHHAASVAGLLAIVTGLLMMFRIDTWFGPADPDRFFSDAQWGVVYVLHGLGGVALITLVITHIYFAVRPDKWWITKSMFFGWITKDEYLEHHDPDRWVVGEKGPAGQREPGGDTGFMQGEGNRPT